MNSKWKLTLALAVLLAALVIGYVAVPHQHANDHHQHHNGERVDGRFNYPSDVRSLSISDNSS